MIVAAPATRHPALTRPEVPVRAALHLVLSPRRPHSGVTAVAPTVLLPGRSPRRASARTSDDRTSTMSRTTPDPAPRVADDAPDAHTSTPAPAPHVAGRRSRRRPRAATVLAVTGALLVGLLGGAGAAAAAPSPRTDVAGTSAAATAAAGAGVAASSTGEEVDVRPGPPPPPPAARVAEQVAVLTTRDDRVGA